MSRRSFRVRAARHCLPQRAAGMWIFTKGEENEALHVSGQPRPDRPCCPGPSRNRGSPAAVRQRRPEGSPDLFPRSGGRPFLGAGGGRREPASGRGWGLDRLRGIGAFATPAAGRTRPVRTHVPGDVGAVTDPAPPPMGSPLTGLRACPDRSLFPTASASLTSEPLPPVVQDVHLAGDGNPRSEQVPDRSDNIGRLHVLPADIILVDKQDAVV
jgi:hypothetical protein